MGNSGGAMLSRCSKSGKTQARSVGLYQEVQPNPGAEVIYPLLITHKTAWHEKVNHR